MTRNEEFGNLLKTILEDSEMTDKVFGEKTKLKLSDIDLILRGEKQMRVNQYSKLIKILSMPREIEERLNQLFLQSCACADVEKFGIISGNNNTGNAIIGMAQQVKTKIKNDSQSKYKQTKNEIRRERKAILNDLMGADIIDSEKIKIYKIMTKRG